jgi:hypothetical protein
MNEGPASTCTGQQNIKNMKHMPMIQTWIRTRNPNVIAVQNLTELPLTASPSRHEDVWGTGGTAARILNIGTRRR